MAKRKNPFENMPADEEQMFSDKDIAIAMSMLVMAGVTPEAYKTMYEKVQHLIESGEINNIPLDEDLDFEDFEDEEDDFSSDEEDLFGSMFGGGFGGNKKEALQVYKPMKDAKNKSLVLKIQMKGVTKPPMWREVQVPADISFDRLNEVIQDVVGAEYSHLWQFGKTAYRSDIIIGDPDMLEEKCKNAEKTKITEHLGEEGDEMEYVYDFGDDWTFTITLKKILDEKIPHPKCLKYKGDLNIMEDVGGIYAYMQLREIAEKQRFSKAEKDEIMAHYGVWYDDFKQFLDWLREQKFDLQETNEILAE